MRSTLHPCALWLVAAALLAPWLGGCVARPYAEMSPEVMFDDGGASGDGLAAAGSTRAERKGEATPPSASPESPNADPTPAAANRPRTLVHEARLAVDVANVDDSVAWLTARVGELGGYVARRIDRRVAARVPVAAFPTLLDEIRARGAVQQESVVALDVTDQHRDLTIRLANARRAHERLSALLERATAVEDVLKIERELQRLTTEIERLTAELETLDQRVALSLIEVEWRELTREAPRRPVREPSRFEWIRNIGVEHVRRQF